MILVFAYIYVRSDLNGAKNLNGTNKKKYTIHNYLHAISEFIEISTFDFRQIHASH